MQLGNVDCHSGFEAATILNPSLTKAKAALKRQPPTLLLR